MAMFEILGKVMTRDDRLVLSCHACGHRAEWPRARAVAAFGEFAPPWQVRDRARCGACGERERVTVTL